MVSYSIIFVPKGKTFQKFSKIIAILAKKNSAPEFKPHVSLIGNIRLPEKEVLSKSRLLASKMRSFEIRLGKVDYLDMYFRSLFVRAEISREISEADSLARKYFLREKDPPYMPHLSLLYGNFSRERKEGIIQQIGKEFKDKFLADKIEVWAVPGIDPAEWKVIKKIALKKARPIKIS